MSKSRIAVAAGLCIVLGLLVGLGFGALAWGDQSKKHPAPAAVSPTAGEPLLRITRHVDVGTYVWVLDARQAQPTTQGTNVTLHLTDVQPYVHGFSNGPGHQVLAIPLEHFFGTGADAYDFGVPYTMAAVVRTTGSKGAQPVDTQIIAARLHGSEVDLTLAAPTLKGAEQIAADTTEPISILVDGGPLGLRH